MSAITPVPIQVALKDMESPASFTFAREWTFPSLVLMLSSTQMPLLNLFFLVADYELAGEGVLIGFPILVDLGIDSRTQLKRNWIKLSSTDCSPVCYNKKANVCETLGR